MHYIRRIAQVAVAGVVVAGIVASNREIVSQLVRGYNRKKQVKKLESWYKSQIEEVEEYANLEMDRYLESHRNLLLLVAKRKGYSRKRTRAFLKSVGEDARKVIVAYQKGQVSKKYGEYLYDVDTNRGYNAELETRVYMKEAGELADKLRDRGCPADSLFISLRITPPD